MASFNLNAISVLFLLSFAIIVKSRTLCDRIFFRSERSADNNEDVMPYQLIEGVYVKQNYKQNRFPVYQGERSKLLLYYNRSSLTFGQTLSSNIGIGVALLPTLPAQWLSSGSVNPSDVFYGLASSWVYTIHTDNTRSPLTINGGRVVAMCVGKDFRVCLSDRIVLNVSIRDENGNSVNNASKDYFYRIKGSFHRHRPVYKHSSKKFELCLQYTAEDNWVIMAGLSRRCGHDFKGRVIMKARDKSLRPEYITSPWLVNRPSHWLIKNNGSPRWLFDNNSPLIRLRCKGIYSTSNCSSNIPCTSGSTCVHANGEIFCVCLPGYYGLTCNMTDKCPLPQLSLALTNNISNPTNHLERIPGSLLMTLCRQGPQYFTFSICNDKINSLPKWSRGKRCSLPRNQDTNLASRNEKEKQNLPNALEIFAIAYGVMCWSVQMFSLLFIIVMGCPVVKTTTERLSQCCYCFSFLWMANVILCAWIKSVQYKTTLQNASVVSLLFNILVVTIESLLSEDFRDIKNLPKNESILNYILRLQNTPPVVMVTSKCFHIESAHVHPITTAVQHMEFSFSVWMDVSDRFRETDIPLSRLKLSKLVCLGDGQTKRDAESFINDITSRNVQRDACVEIKWKTHIPDYKQNVFLYTDSRNQPYWTSLWCFLFAIVVFLVWPYRWFARRNTATTSYTLTKMIYTRRRSDMQMHRVSTNNPDVTMTQRQRMISNPSTAQYRQEELQQPLAFMTNLPPPYYAVVNQTTSANNMSVSYQEPPPPYSVTNPNPTAVIFPSEPQITDLENSF